MMVFGHRGAKQYGPENTIGTIKKGRAVGMDGVELDIRTTMDDRPVIMHDATVDRTTNSSGEVCKMNEDVVLKLDAGEGEKVPSLINVLDEFRRVSVTFLLELKHPSTALPTADILDHYIQNKGMSSNRLIVISFYHQLLVMIKEKYPKIITGASIKSIPESMAACGEYTQSHYVLPPIDELDENFMQDAQQRSQKVITWVCDSEEQIKKAKTLGVHGVISSDPKMVIDING